jgi:hypothetical protein
VAAPNSKEGKIISTIFQIEKRLKILFSHERSPSGRGL